MAHEGITYRRDTVRNKSRREEGEEEGGWFEANKRKQRKVCVAAIDSPWQGENRFPGKRRKPARGRKIDWFVSYDRAVLWVGYVGSVQSEGNSCLKGFYDGKQQ